MRDNGAVELTKTELQQKVWQLEQENHLQRVLLELSPQNLIATNRRLNRRCQTVEKQLHTLEYMQLVTTNRRLNRRCQAAEKELLDVHREYDVTLKELSQAARQAHRYAGELRDIYDHHRIKFRCYGCWWCKLKWRFKRAMWKMWQMNK